MKNSFLLLITIIILGCNNQPQVNKTFHTQEEKIEIEQNTPKATKPTYSTFELAELKFKNKNYLESIKLYEEVSAENNINSINSKIKLGDIYFKGNGVDKNSTKALNYYLLADQNNNIELKYKIANTYDTLAISLSVRSFIAETDQSLDALIKFKLSKKDEKQKEVLYKKAREYLKEPLEYKMPKAQALMARYHLYGIAIKEDIHKGILLYEEAGNNNDEASQIRLGYLYYDSNKVNKDLNKAIYWFEKAANNGNVEAQFQLGWLYSETKDSNIKDLKKSVYWYEYGCKQKDTASCNNLGRAYEFGIGVSKDIYKAVSYYEKSANNNGDFGQMNMGHVYLNGNGKTKNYTEAFYWFKKSADQKNKWSQNEVGILLVKGLGTNKDYKLASEYFLKASDQNMTESKAYLSIMYKHGFGVKKDLKESNKYKSLVIPEPKKASRNDYSMAKLLWNEYVLLGIVKEEEK